MTADEQKEAFAKAAAAARLVIEVKQQRRAQLEAQICAVQDEIARLEVVAGLDGPAPKRAASPTFPTLPGDILIESAAPTKKRRNEWVGIVREVIASWEPGGIPFDELRGVLREHHAYKHSTSHLRELLERMERDRVFSHDGAIWHLYRGPTVREPSSQVMATAGD